MCVRVCASVFVSARLFVSASVRKSDVSKQLRARFEKKREKEREANRRIDRQTEIQTNIKEGGSG